MNPTASDEQRQRIEDFQRTNQLGLATLFFSDLVGSMQLKQSLGDRAAIGLIQAHHAAFRELLAQFPKAEEIDTAGDSFFLIFAAPSDAVRFALLAQALTHALATGNGHPLRDRIGIHVGEVFIKAAESGGKPKDLFGTQVDTCARIMSLGEGDQILLSRFAFDSARQAMRGDALDGTGDIAWLNHGFYELKGVEEPVEICEVGEVGRARLVAPEAGEKGHRIVTGDEPVLGWRPAAGQTVPNTQWVLDRLLGEGGFGEVWLARHQTLKDRRVLKFCFNAEKARSLKREVTLFRVLREHVGAQPGIVAVHDVYFDQPPYYIVMDHIDGPTLAGWAEAHAPLDAVPLATRLEIVAQIADALQTAHDAGVIHRDVKPSNILIAEEAGAPRAMLTDFGIGQLVSGDALAGITQIGFTKTMMAADSMTGTQLYLAPELLSGQPATIRSDIYALGIVLYQLVIGALNRPLTSDWADDIADPLLREDIQHCVAGDPAKRFAGGAQLSANLRALPQRRTEKENAERLQARVVRRKKQMRLVSFAGAAVAVAALFFAFAFVREHDLKLKVAEEGRRAERGEVLAKAEAKRAEAALADLKASAPALLQLAESEADAQRFASALGKLDAALALDPALLRARWQRAWVLLALERWSEAADALRLARQHDPAGAQLASILPAVEKVAAAPEAGRWKSDAAREVFAHLQSVEATGPALAFSAKLKLGAAERLKIADQRLLGAFGKGNYFLTIENNGLVTVVVQGKPLRSLDAFRGLPIDSLNAAITGISDLEPLRGLPLQILSASSNKKLTDLSPLRGMPLRELNIGNTPVTDLSPLTGMKLDHLSIYRTNVIELAPLAGIKLTELNISETAISRIEALRGMPLVTLIATSTNKLADYSPLKGAPLETLRATATAMSDLSFVKGMPVRSLEVNGSKVSNIDALHGLPLENLDLGRTTVSDLTPLQGAPLRILNLRGCKQLTDYTPVLTLPRLERLHCDVLPAALLPLRESATLQSIEADAYPGEGSQGARPVADFWRAYDAHQAAQKK